MATPGPFPNDLPGLCKWFARQLEHFQEFPNRNPTYWRIVNHIDGRAGTVQFREPNPSHVAARIHLAQRAIDEAQRWLRRHDVAGRPEWPHIHRADVGDDWPKQIHIDHAEDELWKILNFLRALAKGSPAGANGLATTTPENPPAKRGRKKADYDTIQAEAARAADWERARETGVFKADFAKQHGLRVKELNAILARVRQRKSRANN